MRRLWCTKTVFVAEMVIAVNGVYGVDGILRARGLNVFWLIALIDESFCLYGVFREQCLESENASMPPANSTELLEP